MTTIGFIGFGKMAEAICRAILDSGLAEAGQIRISELNEERQNYIQESLAIQNSSITELIRNCQTILICIKPQQITALLEDIKSEESPENTLWISILAGTSIETLEKGLGEKAAICRVMPNTPMLIGKGISALYSNEHCSDEQKALASSLCSAGGPVVHCERETDIDVVTGISGSGPAFIYQIASEMIEVGIEKGLNQSDATALAAHTLVGAGEMLIQTKQSPEELIAAVSSPNGTTVAGLETYKHLGISQAFQDVIKRSIHRATELSKGD